MSPSARAVLIGALAAASATGWWLLHPPDLFTLDARRVRQVEVQLEPWGGETTIRPVTATEDRHTIDGLMAVVRSAEETHDHKCGSRGIVTFRQANGLPVQVRFLPGHHEKWYEFRTGDKVYRAPRGEFVTALRRVGVEVPLKCQ